MRVGWTLLALSAKWCSNSFFAATGNTLGHYDTRMPKHRKRTRLILLVTGTLAVVVVGGVACTTPRAHSGRVSPQDFETLGKNPQGYPEYRTRRTGIMFVALPGGTYEIDVLDSACSRFTPDDFSLSVTLVNPKFGDVAAPFDTGAQVWAAPDGSVDVPSDVSAIIEKFKNTATAPTKARADIQTRDVDLVINITDVVAAIDAFAGLPYPFTPSTTSPCP